MSNHEASQQQRINDRHPELSNEHGPSLTDAYGKTLDKLLGEIDNLPDAQRTRLHAAADEAKQRHERLSQSIGKLQETLDFLRLGVKYLAFDVEATKRENAYLRKLLDEAEGND
jgi:hypothetical protein